MTETEKICEAIRRQSKADFQQFLIAQTESWQCSEKRLEQIAGVKYFKGQHDILHRERTAVDGNGFERVVKYLPNNRIVNNVFEKIVEQKTNYLLGKPFVIESAEAEEINKIFDADFMNKLKTAYKNALISGVGWMYYYYGESGKIEFVNLKPENVLPFWSDEEHTELDLLLRKYEVECCEGKNKKMLQMYEVYYKDKIETYESNDGRLELKDRNPYVTNGEQAYTWGQIPIIAIRHNSDEIPLIRGLKSLQDALNLAFSDLQNNLQENAHNTSLVIKGYENTDLAEFRKNFAAYGVMLVGENGGVDLLKTDFNAENYKTTVEMLRNAMVEAGKGFDCKFDKLGGTPNEMNLQSMYSDIDLDANGAEAEIRSALLRFLQSLGYKTDDIDIIFNRDMLMNEGDVINNIRASVGILSQETLREQHPWTKNLKLETERVNAEARQAEVDYGFEER
jgi:SPP1 family phage portal protein